MVATDFLKIGRKNIKNRRIIKNKGEIKMARLVRPTWAIRCTQSSCRTLFEVAVLEDGKQQEVVCPNCGEHYVYPITKEDEEK